MQVQIVVKRFITYLYSYDGKNKGKNVGFIKVEINGEKSAFLIQIKNLGRFSGRGSIYLVFADCIGVEIGEIPVRNGEAREIYDVETNNVRGSGNALDSVLGVKIELNDAFLASCWTDDAQAVVGNPLKVWSREVQKQNIMAAADSDNANMQPSYMKSVYMRQNAMPSDIENTPNKPNIESMQNITNKSNTSNIEIAPVKNINQDRGVMPGESSGSQYTYNKSNMPVQTDDSNKYNMNIDARRNTNVNISPNIDINQTTSNISSNNTTPNNTTPNNTTSNSTTSHQNPSDIRTPDGIERIDISELRMLPTKNWYLVNNSFLAHGYANYKHLVIKTDVNGQKHLGVPGVSEPPERMMAKIFGFSQFEPAAPASAADVDSGVFGYWFCPLEL